MKQGQRVIFDEAAFTDRWNRGLRLVEIAEEFGGSIWWASKAAQRLGLPKRAVGRPRREDESSDALTGGRWVLDGRVQRWEWAT